MGLVPETRTCSTRRVSISTPAGAVTESPVAPVADPITEILSAPLRNSFDYTRSLGPVLSQFALALRDGRILGSRSADGRVFVPHRIRSATGAASTELVEVASTGTVTTWSWQAEPTAGQPLSEPFAWALIKLDGADTALLHAVACKPGQISTGARVHAVFRAVRTGRIDDIAHFALGDEPVPAPEDTSEHSDNSQVIITTPIASEINHSATAWSRTTCARSTRAGSSVRGSAPASTPAASTSAARREPRRRRTGRREGGSARHRHRHHVLHRQRAVHRSAHQTTVCGRVRADRRHRHPRPAPDSRLPADEVRMGMRGAPPGCLEDQRELSMGSISHFKPTGEPDAEYDTYRDHV